MLLWASACSGSGGIEQEVRSLLTGTARALVSAHLGFFSFLHFLILRCLCLFSFSCYFHTACFLGFSVSLYPCLTKQERVRDKLCQCPQLPSQLRSLTMLESHRPGSTNNLGNRSLDVTASHGEMCRYLRWSCCRRDPALLARCFRGGRWWQLPRHKGAPVHKRT